MRKILLIILLATVLVFILGTALTLVLPRVTLVQDRTFRMNYPLRGIGSFGRSLLFKGYRLSVVSVEDNELTDKAELERILTKCSSSSRMVVCTPVVTAAARAADIKVKDLGSAYCVGIASVNDGYFDMVLVSQSRPEDAQEGEVDYRFAGENPEAKILIYPDFKLSVIPLLKAEKVEAEEGFLFYDKVKTR